jgi:hypothetical protein
MGKDRKEDRKEDIGKAGWIWTGEEDRGMEYEDGKVQRMEWLRKRPAGQKNVKRGRSAWVRVWELVLGL